MIPYFQQNNRICWPWLPSKLLAGWILQEAEKKGLKNVRVVGGPSQVTLLWVFYLGVFWNLPRNTKNGHFFLSLKNFRKQWWNKCVRKTEIDNFWKLYVSSLQWIPAARLLTPCLLLPVAHVKSKARALHICWKPQWIWAKNLCFHRLVDDYLRANYCNNGPQKKKGWLYTFMRDINLHHHSLVVCHHMSQQCVKIGLW